MGDIGTRSGEQVDLRYYFGVSGIVDSTIAPFATDAQGNLLHIPYLYGIEANAGVYGVHRWKRSQLGLNYAGSYTKYLNYDAYNGTSHALTLGYTDQISRRLKLDLRESAGSLIYGTGQVADVASTDLNSSFTPATRLFDTRTYYLQSTASVTWLQSARISYTAGGGAFLQNLKSTGLSNAWGYNFNANMMRRMSKSSTVGVTYEYSHFEFPGFSASPIQIHFRVSTPPAWGDSGPFDRGGRHRYLGPKSVHLCSQSNSGHSLGPVDDHRNHKFPDNLSQRHGHT